MLPTERLTEFKDWFALQRRPAVELAPDPAGLVGRTGSRLGGPALLAEGETWPNDERGVPLEFIAQLDCRDCQTIPGFPASGIVQFFIGRDDLFGLEIDDLFQSNILVRLIDAEKSGVLAPPPPLVEVEDIVFSNFSPLMKDDVRERGLCLKPVPIEDRMDSSIMEMEQRLTDLYRQFDVRGLEAFVESEEVVRPVRHHAGGFPAFAQTDIRYDARYSEFDCVLLRLTSDGSICWGDLGEAVFMMRPDDLAKGDFSQVVYSWDCH